MRKITRWAALTALVLMSGPQATAAYKPPDAVDAACRLAGPLSCPAWYFDSDGDGYGDPSTERLSPVQPDGYIATGDDCDDTDPGVYPGAPEAFDGRDNDCDGEIDEIVLVVSELMINPSAVADTAGEYVEIANASDEPVDLSGVAVVVGTRSCPVDGILGPLSQLVVARVADPALNGGFEPDTTCPITLGNTSGRVQVSAPTRVLDAVDYTGWTIPNGASLGLDGGTWCPQVTLLPAGDRGTPGWPNDPCGT